MRVIERSFRCDAATCQCRKHGANRRVDGICHLCAPVLWIFHGFRGLTHEDQEPRLLLLDTKQDISVTCDASPNNIALTVLLHVKI